MEEVRKLKLPSLYHKKRLNDWMEIVSHEVAELQSTASSLFLPSTCRPEQTSVALSVLKAILLGPDETPSLLQVQLPHGDSQDDHGARRGVGGEAGLYVAPADAVQGQHTATWVEEAARSLRLTDDKIMLSCYGVMRGTRAGGGGKVGLPRLMGQLVTSSVRMWRQSRGGRVELTLENKGRQCLRLVLLLNLVPSQ
eukprot:398359-Hanusia_phi.AAC.3